MMLIWGWYILGCVILLLISRYHFKRRKLYLLASSLQGPPALPLVGNALAFLCKEEELFGKMSFLIEKYSTPIRFWLGPKLVVILKTAVEMEKVLSSPKLNDKDDIYRFMKVFDGLSLFTTNGFVWKKQRKLLTPLLSQKYMEGYFTAIRENAALLIKKLEEQVDKETFDVEYYLQRCYTDIVAEVLLGFNPEAQNGKVDEILSAIHRMYVLVHSRMLKLWLHPDFIFELSSNGREQKKGRELLHKYVQKGINLIESRENDCSYTDNENFISILEKLIKIKNKDPSFYADQNEIDHISTLYSAAEDTVTSACSYLLVLLGMYPDVQNKVLEEIKTVLGHASTTVEYKDLADLKYFDMCVKEVLRLFPIGPYILRKTKEDFELGEHILPKDCTVVLSFYSVQRNPEYWEKPNEFYPEHFLPEAVCKRHPYAFLPFSSGARSCPGQVFAHAAVKAVAITILQHYVIETDGTLQDIKLKADISIRPVDGHRLRIKKRIN